jgi:hypothetical protein
MAQTWLNNDSLYIKFGKARATAGIAGDYATPASGGQTVLEIDLDLTTLGSASAIIEDNVQVSKYAWIDKVEVETLVAATGSSAALNLGLIRTDRSTTYDEDGILQAIAVTDMDAVGETKTYSIAGAAAAGALVGTQLANNGLLCADYDTHTFDTGKVKIRIFYHMNANR